MQISVSNLLQISAIKVVTLFKYSEHYQNVTVSEYHAGGKLAPVYLPDRMWPQTFRL